MIDTHCHIDLYDNPQKVLLECDLADITVIGMTNLPSHFNLGFEHVRPYRRIRLALGMHPLYASYHEQEMPLFIDNLRRTSYIGEIGLDFSNEGILTKNIQINSFNRILKEVSGLPKLLSIHSRKAESEVLSLLKKHQIACAIFHWYSGPISVLSEIVAAGYYFSINPAMVVSKSGQKMIKQIPIERLLTETDGPFTNVAGRTTMPRDVSYVYGKLGAMLEMSPGQVEELISSNFKRLLAKMKSTC